MKTIAILLSVIVIAINVFFVYGTLSELNLSAGLITVIVIVAILYLIFVLYLSVHMIASMRNDNLMHIPFIKKYVMNDGDRTLTNI